MAREQWSIIIFEYRSSIQSRDLYPCIMLLWGLALAKPHIYYKSNNSCSTITNEGSVSNQSFTPYWEKKSLSKHLLYIKRGSFPVIYCYKHSNSKTWIQKGGRWRGDILPSHPNAQHAAGRWHNIMGGTLDEISRRALCRALKWPKYSARTLWGTLWGCLAPNLSGLGHGWLTGAPFEGLLEILRWMWATAAVLVRLRTTYWLVRLRTTYW